MYAAIIIAEIISLFNTSLLFITIKDIGIINTRFKTKTSSEATIKIGFSVLLSLFLILKFKIIPLIIKRKK